MTSTVNFASCHVPVWQLASALNARDNTDDLCIRSMWLDYLILL